MADPTIAAWRPEIARYVPGAGNTEADNAVVLTVLDFCAETKLWVEKLAPITIQVVEDKTDIAFTDDDPDTITYTAGDFTDYFAAGDIIVTDHVSTDTDPISKDNVGPFLIGISAANLLTLNAAEKLVAEAAGVAVSISKALYALTSSNGDIVEVTDVKVDGKFLDPKGEPWLDKHIEKWRTNMSSTAKYYTVDRKNNLRIVPVPDTKITNGLEVWAALKPTRTVSAATITDPTSIEPFIFLDWFEAISDGAIYRLLSMTSQPWRDFSAAEFYFNRYTKAKRDASRRQREGHSRPAESGMTA